MEGKDRIVDIWNKLLDRRSKSGFAVRLKGAAYVKHRCSYEGTLVPDMKIVSDNIFTKSKGNALTSEEFADFIPKNGISHFYITGADAIACVKSTCLNMRKENYNVTVLSDCITSYDKRKIQEMLCYYESKGCIVEKLSEIV